MRRISSLASFWPRTSSRRTPQSASPGSKPLICEMPIIIIGPMKSRMLAKKRKKTNITCVQSDLLEKSFPSACTKPVKTPVHDA